LGCACIKATVDGFLNDLNYYGFFFENTVFKDLKVYASILGYEVFQYRDNANLEIDAIIEIDNLDYLAIEIKLGTNKIDEAIENFKRFKKKMENGGYKQPKYCIVIVGVGGIYQIKEDVIIIPYDLLGF
jgi:predicted AAA+ superfamily ATPase